MASEPKQDLTEPIDLRSLEYVEQPNHHLFCDICVTPFVDPVSTPCGHDFCSSCFRAWSRQNNCPTCRRELPDGSFELRPSTSLSKILDELKVRCPNSECTETVERSEIQAHVDKYCDYTLLQCAGCDERIERKHQDEECLHRIVSCSLCNVELAKKDLKSHQLESCKASIKICADCNQSISAPAFAQHQNNDCERATISCPGSTLGCSVSDLRIVINQHTKQCPMALMVPSLGPLLQEKESEAQRKITELQRKIYRLHSELNRHMSNCKHDRSSTREPRLSADAEERLVSLEDENFMLRERLRVVETASAASAESSVALHNEIFQRDQALHFLHGRVGALELALKAAGPGRIGTLDSQATTPSGMMPSYLSPRMMPGLPVRSGSIPDFGSQRSSISGPGDSPGGSLQEAGPKL
jgi:DNA repair exonuclease SbcCD ATPase subunit